MGRQVLQYEPKFKDTVNRIDKHMRKHGIRWSLMAELQASEESSRMQEPEVSQPAVFAVQVGISELLKSWGINPSVVVGHSLGEFAAAFVSGSITLKEAVGLVVTRSRLHQSCKRDGAMGVIGMSKRAAEDLLKDLGLQTTINIAAINDHHNVTVSGDREGIEMLDHHFKNFKPDIFWRTLQTPRAFHSHHMEDINIPFMKAVKKLRPNLYPKSNTIPFVSTVTGYYKDGKSLNESYWWRNIRAPVQFQSAMECILSNGYTVFVEIGPQPQLGHYVRSLAKDLKINDVEILTSLPKKHISEQHQHLMLNTVGKLYTLGYPISWTSIQGEGSKTFLRPPGYSWQTKEFWYLQQLPPKEITPFQSPITNQSTYRSHPFLNYSRPTTRFTGLRSWETEIDLHKFPYLKDHRLKTAGTVMPGAVYVEMAFAMAEDALVCDVIELKSVKLSSLLTLTVGQVRLLRLRLQCNNSNREGQYHITCTQPDGSELLLSSGEIEVDGRRRGIKRDNQANTTEGGPETNSSLDCKVQTIKDRLVQIPVSTLKEKREAFGFDYGRSFSLIEKAWQSKYEAFTLISTREIVDNTSDMGEYTIHPCIFDALLQNCFLLEVIDQLQPPIVPLGFHSIKKLSTCLPDKIYCHVHAINKSSFNLIAMDMIGNPLLVVEDFQVGHLETSHKDHQLDDICYEVSWSLMNGTMTQTENKQVAMSPDTSWLLVYQTEDNKTEATNSGQAKFFADLLTKDGVHYEMIEFSVNNEKTSEELESILTRSDFQRNNLYIVNFVPLLSSQLELSADNSILAQKQCYELNIDILNALAKHKRKDTCLTILTASVNIVCEEDEWSTSEVCPWGSLAWGLRRSAQLEMPTIKMKIMDLSLENIEEEMAVVYNHILTGEEDEIVIRRGLRFTNYVVPSKDIQSFNSNTPPFPKRDFPSNVYIQFDDENSASKLLRGLRGNLVSSQVEVEVLFATKSVQKDLVGFTGKVTRKHENVSEFMVDDVICGVCSRNQLAHHTIIDSNQTVLKPQAFETDESSLIPMSCIVANHLLSAVSEENSNLLFFEPRDKIALTTMVMAYYKGFQVTCATRNERVAQKLRKLKSFKVTDCTIQSQSQLNKDNFDLVITFEPPCPLDAKWLSEVLIPGGRCVTLAGGSNARDKLPITISNKHVVYEFVTLDDVLLKTPFAKAWQSGNQAKEFLEEISNILKQMNSIFCLPEVFKINKEVQSNWSWEEEIRRGEVCVSPGREIEEGFLNSSGLKPDRSYLVVGGVRGFGFEVARWMATKGAKDIIAISRSKPNESTEKDIKKIEKEHKTRFHVWQIDVTSPSDIKKLEERLDTLPSLAGIVHSAMVLDDSTIDKVEFYRSRKVLAPKVEGSILLHQMKCSSDLDFIIYFSSLTSVIGNFGQTAYGAANYFMDILAQHRRYKMGLPSLSLNWGPIGGTGALDRDKSSATFLAKSGFEIMPVNTALKMMDHLLSQPIQCTQVFLAYIDWPKLLRITSFDELSTRAKYLKEKTRDEDGPKISNIDSLATQLLVESKKENKEERAWKYIVGLMEWWMGTPLDDIEMNRSSSLSSFGVDSAVALNMKLKIEATLQLSFETFYFMQPETSVLRLTHDIIAKIEERQKQVETHQGTSKPSQDSSETTTEDLEVDEVEQIDEHSSQQDGCRVFPLYNPESSAVTLFCVHPGHRYAMTLLPFTEGFLFQNMVSMYGIGFPETETPMEDWGSISELASHYVSLIQGVQPQGPYFLSGYSYGGIVAYEIASHLTAANQEVAFLSMIDTFAWYPSTQVSGKKLRTYYENSAAVQDHMKHQVYAFLRNVGVKLLHLQEEEFIHLTDIYILEEAMTKLQDIAHQQNIQIPNLHAVYQSITFDLQVATRTCNDWLPPKVVFPGRLMYLEAEDSFITDMAVMGSAADSWSDVTNGNIDVITVPGNHFTLAESSNAKQVGEILSIATLSTFRRRFPTLNFPPLFSLHERAIKKMKRGVKVIFCNSRGSTEGTLLLDSNSLNFRFTPLAVLSRNVTIPVKDIRLVLPGCFNKKAVKYVRERNYVEKHRVVQIDNIVTVTASQNVYNIECIPSSCEVLEFMTVIEAVMRIPMMHK